MSQQRSGINRKVNEWLYAVFRSVMLKPNFCKQPDGSIKLARNTLGELQEPHRHPAGLPDRRSRTRS
jgi:hypothetical protein